MRLEYAVLDIDKLRWYKGATLKGRWKWTKYLHKAALMTKEDAKKFAKRTFILRAVRL